MRWVGFRCNVQFANRMALCGGCISRFAERFVFAQAHYSIQNYTAYCTHMLEPHCQIVESHGKYPNICATVRACTRSKRRYMACNCECVAHEELSFRTRVTNRIIKHKTLCDHTYNTNRRGVRPLEANVNRWLTLGPQHLIHSAVNLCC